MRFLFISLLFAQACFAQNNQKTLAVQGKAKTKVKPDIAYISFTIEKSDTSQARAMSKANQQVDELTRILNRQGLTAQQLKIADYQIRNDDNNDRRRKEYSVSNHLIATLALNGKQINQILKNIEAQKINGIEVSFEFGLSDSLEQVSRKFLVQKAIEDAKANAENISQALKVQLKSISQILKQGLELPVFDKLTDSFYKPPVIESAKGVVFNSAFNNLDVEEKELNEDITIVYEIGS